MRGVQKLSGTYQRTICQEVQTVSLANTGHQVKWSGIEHRKLEVLGRWHDLEEVKGNTWDQDEMTNLNLI